MAAASVIWVAAFIYTYRIILSLQLQHGFGDIGGGTRV